MKKNFLLGIAAVAVILSSTSCNKNQVEPQQPKTERNETSTLKISLQNGGEIQTRAASVDSTSEGKETVLGDVQIFVMSDGDLEKYVHVNNWDSLAKASGSLEISVKDGYKDVMVICNGPDLSDKSSDIKSSIMELSAYNDPDTCFVMYGEKYSLNVTAGETANCAVKVSRYVSKIYIAQIKNNLPPQFGTITLNYAFLANLPAKVSIGGAVKSGTSDIWYNKYGRKSENPLVSGHIIDGSTYLADAPKLSFKSYSDTTVALGDSITAKKTFYCLPNTQSNGSTSFSTTFQPCCTKAIIAATINGTKYYYAIDMGVLDRNHVYAVYLTISGLGSDDPTKSVTKGSIQSTISIKAWEKTTAIEEDI